MPVSDNRTVLSLQSRPFEAACILLPVSVRVTGLVVVEVSPRSTVDLPVPRAQPRAPRRRSLPARPGHSMLGAASRDGGEVTAGDPPCPLSQPSSPPSPDSVLSLSWNSSSFLFTPCRWGNQSGPVSLGTAGHGVVAHALRPSRCSARADLGLRAFALRKIELRRSERTGAPGGLHSQGFREAAASEPAHLEGEVKSPKAVRLWGWGGGY